MRNRYRVHVRAYEVCHSHNTTTCREKSLKTRNRYIAERFFAALNQANEQMKAEKILTFQLGQLAARSTGRVA